MEPQYTTPSTEALLENAAWVRRLASHLIGDAHLAQDVAQESVLASLEKPPGFGPDSKRVRRWLAGVVRRKAADALRREGDRLAAEKHAARPEASNCDAESVDRLRLHRRLVEAVLALDAPYRTAVVRRYFDDLPPHEIAQHLGIAPATARKRISRGLEQLRGRLDQEFGGDRKAWVIGIGNLLQTAAPPSAPTVPPRALVSSAHNLAMPALLGVPILGLALSAGIFLWQGQVPDLSPVQDNDALAEAHPQGLMMNPEPFTNGEVRAVRLGLIAQSDERFVGRVVEAEDGKPISGALVRMVPYGSGPVYRTGPQGWFEIPLAARKRQEGQVEAKGFGPKVIKLNARHGNRDRALVVSLQRGATLRGLILGTPHSVDLVVRVEAYGFEFASTPGLGHPSGLDLRRRAPVAKDGSWVMTDLPPGVGLKLELRRGEELVLKVPDHQYLKPGEERSFEWPLGSLTTLHGRAVIADTNEPLPARSIWLVPGPEAHTPLLPGNRFVFVGRPVARATTDDEGRFAFPDLPPGNWAVGPAPSREGEGDEIAAMPTWVSIPMGARTMEVELLLYRGLYISGEVLGVDGKRAKSATTLYAYNPDNNGKHHCPITEGTFRVGPLVPGNYWLRARGDADTSESESVTAMAGAMDVVLQLNAGGSIQGRMVDAATGESVEGGIERRGKENSVGQSASTRSDGSFSWGELPYGSYTLIGSSGDLVGSVKGVVIGPLQSVTNLEIALEPGAVLLVTVHGEEPPDYIAVHSGEFSRSAGRLRHGQPWRTLWPPGQAVVTFHYESGDGEKHTVERTVDLVVGKATEIKPGNE